MNYVIDHEDSFTYNLVHLLEGFAPTYVSNYYDLDRKKLEKSKLLFFHQGLGIRLTTLKHKKFITNTRVLKKLLVFA